MRRFRVVLVGAGLLVLASACSLQREPALENTPPDITGAQHEHGWNGVIGIRPIQ